MMLIATLGRVILGLLYVGGKVQLGWGQPTSYTMGTGSFPG